MAAELVAVEFGDIQKLLQPDEEFSCCHTGKGLLLLGTTLGTVHIATIDGVFISSRKFHQHSIEHISLSSRGVIVASDIHGGLACWDWQRGGQLDSEWGGTLPFASILPSETFNIASGALFLSHHGGALVRRARGTYFGFNDTLIFDGVADGSADQLHLYAGHLIFAARDSINVFSLARNRVLSRFHPSNTAGAQEVVFAIHRHTLAAAWGHVLYLCDLQSLDTCPFAVLKFVVLESPVSALAFTANFLILAFREERAPAKQERPKVYGNNPLVVFDRHLLRFADAVSLPQEQTSVAMLSGLCMHEGDATHCIVLAARMVVCLRVPRISEQVVALVSQERFAEAMHLVSSQPHRERATIEVADLHATHLWSQHRYADAMTVWGESVLPWAPAAFWDKFISNLAHCDKLDLIVKWLPFNDRGKVSSAVYERLLRNPLLSGRYERFLSRVAKWPVLYNADNICSAAGLVLVEQGLALDAVRRRSFAEPVDHATAAPWCLLLTAMYKLYEFGNRFLEAAQIIVLCKYILAGRSVDLAETDTDDEAHAYALRAAVRDTVNVDVFKYFERHGLWKAIWPPEETADAGAVGPVSESYSERRSLREDSQRPAVAVESSKVDVPKAGRLSLIARRREPSADDSVCADDTLAAPASFVPRLDPHESHGEEAAVSCAWASSECVHDHKLALPLGVLRECQRRRNCLLQLLWKYDAVRMERMLDEQPSAAAEARLAQSATT